MPPLAVLAAFSLCRCCSAHALWLWFWFGSVRRSLAGVRFLRAECPCPQHPAEAPCDLVRCCQVRLGEAAAYPAACSRLHARFRLRNAPRAANQPLAQQSRTHDSLWRGVHQYRGGGDCRPRRVGEHPPAVRGDLTGVLRWLAAQLARPSSAISMPMSSRPTAGISLSPTAAAEAGAGGRARVYVSMIRALAIDLGLGEEIAGVRIPGMSLGLRIRSPTATRHLLARLRPPHARRQARSCAATGARRRLAAIRQAPRPSRTGSAPPVSRIGSSIRRPCAPMGPRGASSSGSSARGLRSAPARRPAHDCPLHSRGSGAHRRRSPRCPIASTSLLDGRVWGVGGCSVPGDEEEEGPSGRRDLDALRRLLGDEDLARRSSASPFSSDVAREVLRLIICSDQGPVAARRPRHRPADIRPRAP